MKKAFVTIGVLVLGLALFVQTRGALPKAVAANVVIQTPGFYVSPSGDRFVRVTEDTPGAFYLYFFHGSKQGEVYCGAGVEETLPAGTSWSICWDAQDRLWNYVPGRAGLSVYQWREDPGSIGSTYYDKVGPSQNAPEAFLEVIPRDLISE